MFAKICLGLMLIIVSMGFYINYSINNNVNTKEYVLEIDPQETFKDVLVRLKQNNVLSTTNQCFLYVLSKINKSDRKIQAGEYLITKGTTSLNLLRQLVAGKVSLYKFTIIEGNRFDQILQALYSQPKIQKTLVNKNCQDILKIIDPTTLNKITECEGLFLPNTYMYAKNTKDIAILQEAYNAMQHKLNILWNNNNLQNSLKSRYEVLIMASIIEKETALVDEMSKVSGVYHRRLQKGMRLQADPTVIYGLKIFDRDLKVADLKKKSKYNTYLNKGLPPTPIASPSVYAIAAALNPDNENSIYFVADGFGGHVFSASFKEHNNAIKLLRKKIKNKK